MPDTCRMLPDSGHISKEGFVNAKSFHARDGIFGTKSDALPKAQLRCWHCVADLCDIWKRIIKRAKRRFRMLQRWEMRQKVDLQNLQWAPLLLFWICQLKVGVPAVMHLQLHL